MKFLEKKLFGCYDIYVYVYGIPLYIFKNF